MVKTALIVESTPVPRERIVVLALEGVVTGNTTERLETAIQTASEEGFDGVVLDLAGVRYIDSEGIGLLISCSRKQSGQGRCLLFACLPPTVKSIFRNARLDLIFETHPNVDAAVDAARRRQQAA